MNDDDIVRIHGAHDLINCCSLEKGGRHEKISSCTVLDLMPALRMN